MDDPSEHLRKIKKEQEDLRKALQPVEYLKKMKDLEKSLLPPAELTRIVDEQRRLDEMVKPINDIIKHTQGIEDQIQRASGLGMEKFLAPQVPRFDDSGFVESMRARAEAAEAPTARRAVQRIVKEIQDFEAGLDDGSEVGIRVVSLPGIIIHVDDIRHSQPNLVIFEGHSESLEPIRLMQHLSQLSFVLMRVSRLEPDKPRRRIGFYSDDNGPAASE
jgi:hypothetical protein